MATAAPGVPPRVTAAAIEHLGGRPLVVRASPRHGCCGGRALVPVADVGPPAEPTRYTVLDAPGVRCYVDPRLVGDVAAWTIDAVGIGPWRRLYLDGATGLPGAADGAERGTVSG
jgi:hypothetical protein